MAVEELERWIRKQRDYRHGEIPALSPVLATIVRETGIERQRSDSCAATARETIFALNHLSALNF